MHSRAAYSQFLFQCMVRNDTDGIPRKMVCKSCFSSQVKRVKRRKFSWRKHGMETFCISFILHAMDEALPSISNFNQWCGEDHKWPLCPSPSNLKYTGCLQDNSSHGRFLWPHNQALKCPAGTLETMGKKTNGLPPSSFHPAS